MKQRNAAFRMQLHGYRHHEEAERETVVRCAASFMDERWRFLQPWCKPVRDLLANVAHHRTSELYVRVHAPPVTEATPSRLRGIRNALLLLTLLARVDSGALEYVLEHYCESWLPNQKDLSCVWPNGFRLTVDNSDKEKKWSPAMLKSLLCDLDDKPVAGLVMAVRKLTRQTSRSQPIILELKVPIAVDFFQISNIEWESADPCLRVLHELYDAHGGWRFCVNLQPSDLRCSFELSSACASVLPGGLTPKVADQICQLTRGNNVLEDLTLNINMPYEVEPITTGWLGKLFHQLLINGRVTSTEFSLTSNFVMYLSRLCTALGEARDVENMTLTMEFVDSEDVDNWIWECVAFALFSKHAQSHSSISQVNLRSVCISTIEAEAISQLLNAEDPLIYFLERVLSMQSEAEDESNRAQVKGVKRAALSKGAVVTQLIMYPEETPATGDCTLENDFSTIYVLENQVDSNECKYVHALIPGYGLCEVSSHDLKPAHDSILQSTTGLTSLSLGFSYFAEEPSEGLPAFLPLIGAPLKRLQLDLPRTEFLNVLGILRACPSLETLIIAETAISASAFIQGIRESNMQLQVLRCRFDDDFTIVEELSKADSPLAQSLREFECRLVTYRESPQRCEFATTFLTMLSANETLVKITVHVARDLKDLCEDKLMECPLSSPREPFSLSCRLAFLSIFRRIGHHDSMPKRGKHEAGDAFPAMPDQHALRTIFAFAAECAFRQVVVHVDNSLPYRSTESELETEWPIFGDDL